MKTFTLKNSLNVLFYGLLFLMSFYIIVTWLFPNESMDIIGVKPYVVVSPSMEPDIKVGDIVVIRQTEESNLNIGDVITFSVYLPAVGSIQLVTHYLADITEDDQGNTIYKTQGANKAPDQYDFWRDEENNPVEITYDDIVGKLWFTIPFLGNIIFILRNPIMLGLIILNVVIIVVLIKHIKAIKRDAKNEVE